MYEFTLPGLGFNDKLNYIFLDNYNNNLQVSKYDRIFFNVYGNFPQCSWAGNGNNLNNILLYGDIDTTIRNYVHFETKIFLDCSNIVFSEKNFGWDSVGNPTLKLLESLGNTRIEISNKEAYDYFKNLNPYFRFIASDKWIFDTNNNHDFDRYIIFPRDLNKVESIDKSKIEIQINNSCNNCSLETWAQCILQETDNISSFKNQSIYKNCLTYQNKLHIKCCDYNNIEDFIKLGYKNFRLPNYMNYSPIIQFSEYTKTFIKEEYYKQFLNLLIQDYYSEED